MVGRQTGHAQINQLAPHRSLDTPVLGYPVLGDGHVRLDLQPADHRRLQPFRWGFDLVQHTVNPVAHAEHLGQRLQVNIRGAHLERFDNDRIDQLDQRRIRLDHRAVCGRRRLDFDMLAREVFNGLLEARIGGHPSPAPLHVILAERRFDVGVGGDAQLDLRAVQQVPQAVYGVEVGRIGYGNCNTVFVLKDRHHPILTGDVPWNRGNDVIGNLQFAEVDHFGAEMRRLGLGDIGRPHHLVGHQEVYDPHAGRLRFLPRFVHLFGGYETQVNQDIS